jgi:hypothetical protein
VNGKAEIVLQILNIYYRWVLNESLLERKVKMKMLNSSKKRLVLIGFVMAVILLGGRRANADFVFGEPVNLGSPINTSSIEPTLCLSADGCSLYFSSDRPGGRGAYDIWMAIRVSINDNWTEPVNLGPVVNSPFQDTPEYISPDGLELYFDALNRTGGKGGWDIWMTKRAAKDDAWGTPINMGVPFNTSAHDWKPCISSDNLTFYFTSMRPGGYGGADIWAAGRATTEEPWAEPVNLGPLVNSSAYDSGEFISGDGLTLFFHSIRPGGSGGHDLWMTRRRTIDDDWNAPVNLGPTVNSASDDIMPNISADGSVLYFCSPRPGGRGAWDIWQAPIIPVVDFNGDGIIDSVDICMMIDHWGTDDPLYDIAPPPFGDGIVDIHDLNLLSEYLLEEIMLPVANAGLSRYAAREPVVLDGTGSYDPDDSGTMSYAWQQISGPSVAITNANVATPAISGFVQTNETQECEFELVVSDGELTSLPDSVKITIVPDFGSSTLKLENASFDANKPTVIYFGGGDCINGNSGQPWNGGPAWTSRANVIDFPNGYSPDSGGGRPTYYKYGDMIIAYLSAVAPDYRQPVQTIGWSAGADPAIDVGIRLNGLYGDARYAVNHVTQLDGGCRITEGWSVYLESVELFLTCSVGGEQGWIDHYYGIVAYPSEPAPRSDILYVRTGLDHIQVRDWYRNSPTGDDKNKFNDGVVGGAYWSVIGPGKNLQLIPEAGVYYFQWNGNAQTGAMGFFNQSEYPGKLPEPVTLLDWHDPWLLEDDPNSFVLTCRESLNAVSYQLLSGTDPYNVADYNIVADGNSPPEVTMAMLPSSDTWWTVKVRDAYGSTIYADPVRVGQPVGLISYWKLDETEGSIAEDAAGDKDGIVYGDAFWQTEGGVKGGALQLDGIEDYISTDFVLNPADGPFSVFAWINSIVPGGVVISQADGIGGSGETWLGTEVVSGKLMTGLVPPPVGRFVSQPLVSESVITDGQWHNIGFVWDGTHRSLYVDGIEVAKDATAQAALKPATGGLNIGAGKNLEAGTFFSGLIDDVRIYNRVVSP